MAGAADDSRCRIEDATVKRYRYETHERLRAHLQLFVDAYKHARRLKTLRGLTPYEHVLRASTKEPEHLSSIRHFTPTRRPPHR